MRRRTNSRRTRNAAPNKDSDADPHDACSDFEDEPFVDSPAAESSAASSADEYDLDHYLLSEEGMRFGDCGQILREALDEKRANLVEQDVLEQAHRTAATRRRKRTTSDSTHPRGRPQKKKRRKKRQRSKAKAPVPWSAEVPLNLRRKRIYGEGSSAVETPNGMESGNEGERERDAKTTRPQRRKENSAGARRVLHNGRSEEEDAYSDEGDNDDDDDVGSDSSSQESNAAAIIRREEMDGDLWDEESLLAAPPRVAGLYWEDLPLRDDADDAPPPVLHRTLLSGADDTFDIVFECDL